jgi:small subunit ribosomal protein S6
MKYELFVLLPNLEDNEIKVADEEIRKIIEKNSGKVVDFYEFGKRKLSYVIKKIRQGFYLDYAIEIDSENLKKLDRELKLNEIILRFDIGKLEGELNKVIQEEEITETFKNNNIESQEENKKEIEEKKVEKKEEVDMDKLDEKLDELIK